MDNGMKRIIKITGFIVGGLLLAAILGALSLYLITNGEYQVRATVSDDSSLPSISIHGVKLHSETFGNINNPVVIILHGGPGGDYRSLLGLKELADQYCVVFYDQRGAGLSQRISTDQLTLAAYIEELDAVVDHFGKGEQVHIIGHSWGAMLLSGYLGYSPEKVAKAVLAEPGFLNMEEMQAWMDYQARFYNDLNYLWFALRTGFEAQHVSGPDDYAADDYLFSEIVHYFTNHPDNPYHCPGESYDAPLWRFGAAASKAGRKATAEEINSLEEGAAVFKNPVLFLAGDCNTWIGPDLQAKHARLYSNARLTVIPDAGHDMFWDNPEAAISAVRIFLNI